MRISWVWGSLLPGTALGAALAVRKSARHRQTARLRNRVVLITGGSRGLGLALAEEFARQGARLAICARQKTSLELARQKLSDMGAEVLALASDVSAQEQVELLIERVNSHFGRIDVLVNNAGIITVGPQQTMTMQDYVDAMNTMFWGMVYPTLAVLPIMRAQGSGHIVNITSIGGKVSVPHLLPYSCAKFAAVGFSQGLHAELARERIGVTTVVPGLMRTGSHVNAFVKGNRQAEYTLFGLLATLPFTSTSAASAARQIVRAVSRNETELIITPQARLMARLHGLMPGLTTNVLSLANRALPRAGEEDSKRLTGRESRTPMGAWLTRLGESAAYTYNQYVRRDEEVSPTRGAVSKE